MATKKEREGEKEGGREGGREREREEWKRHRSQSSFKGTPHQ
jgi:hypothetical protein